MHRVRTGRDSDRLGLWLGATCLKTPRELLASCRWAATRVPLKLHLDRFKTVFWQHFGYHAEHATSTWLGSQLRATHRQLQHASRMPDSLCDMLDTYDSVRIVSQAAGAGAVECMRARAQLACAGKSICLHLHRSGINLTQTQVKHVPLRDFKEALEALHNCSMQRRPPVAMHKPKNTFP